MNVEYKHYVECRMEFLAKGDAHVDSQQRYSLLVEEIPRQLRSDGALKEYFQQLFPGMKKQSTCMPHPQPRQWKLTKLANSLGKVASTSIVMKVPDLDELCNRRDKVLKRLEKCEAIKEATGRRPAHRVGTHKFLDIKGNTSWLPGR